MANVNFVKKSTGPVHYNFDKLDLNANFRIVSGRGAVYRKVREKGTDNWWMLEEASGKLFTPTTSPVELVSVDVIVNADKPSIYNYGGF